MVSASEGHALAVKALLEGGADAGQLNKVRKCGQSDSGLERLGVSIIGLLAAPITSHPRLCVLDRTNGAHGCCLQRLHTSRESAARGRR
jgi:hypothetical protein